MALRLGFEDPAKSAAGEQLLVVHDFKARSADELTIYKGERIQLIERDDDFGDGWYLGKNIEDGRVGLFPEVYTTRAPAKVATNPPPAEISVTPPAQLPLTTNQRRLATPPLANAPGIRNEYQRDTPSIEEPVRLPPADLNSYTSTLSPLNTGGHTPRITSVPAGFPNQTKVALSPARSMSLMMDNKRAHGQESPVMNETLSVIDEHITDMHTPRSSLLTPGDRKINDSGSDYSNYVDRRLSYINGDETDEEERNAHSEEVVSRWTPSQVAAHLKELGVEARHCGIFEEQEISGEVLLAMDQVSVFMKELDLGLVGRRLRTWHKIKAFQEEVQANKASSIRSGLYGGDACSDDMDQSASQSSASASILPRIPSLMDRSSAVSSSREVRHERNNSSHAISQVPHAPPDSPSLHRPQHHRMSSQTEHLSESSVPSASLTTRPPDVPSRPSAASIREFNHSRRHSSMDRRAFSQVSPLLPDASHKKSPSFDRSWTMGNLGPAVSGRSISAIGITALGMSGHALSPSLDRGAAASAMQEFSLDLERTPDPDRGYMSGGEADHKRFRNVLRKREMASVTHSRQSSFNQDKSGNLAVSNKRHSRFGSAGSMSSIRDTISSITSPSFKSSSGDARPRSSTLGTTNYESSNMPPGESSSPVVTKLEYPDSMTTSTKTSPRPTSISPGFGLAAFSHLTGGAGKSRPHIGAKADSDTTNTINEAPPTASTSFPLGQESVTSPSRTASVTTSAASKSIEIDSPNVSSKTPSSTGLAMIPATANTRPKSKKNTSAYTRGLQKRTPQEQMVDCDYSGWMKKKSPSLLTTWKPRLFILRGRRLSYYYSEHDAEEKGLIDISSHRVLPADNEIVAGLHATFTGAKSSPTSPANAQTPTINATESAAQMDSTLQSPGMSSMFIFKLVPPRAGLSRAVNFTKPTVHYFAVDNVKQGRLWMAALMKATIDRDDGKGIITTYQQKTISLAKAQAMKHRPPALMGLEDSDKSSAATPDGVDKPALGSLPEPRQSGLNIQGLKMSHEYIVTEGHKDLTSKEAASASSMAFSNSGASIPYSDPLPTLIPPMVFGVTSNTNTPSTAIASPPLPPEACDIHITPASASPVMSPPTTISLVASPPHDTGKSVNTLSTNERGRGIDASNSDGENIANMERKEVLFAAMNTVGSEAFPN